MIGVRGTLAVCVALALAACGQNGGNSAGATGAAVSSNDVSAGATAEGSKTKGTHKRVLFFLGDGMGIATLTAARIYNQGEEGDLAIDKLPETAFVKTYSNDAQVTDSAPSMAAYMTGVKMNNEVISMSPDTKAVKPGVDANGVISGNNCAADNGQPVATMLEIAHAFGMATGAVTSTRVTHATPAATYSHICHRDLENDIAAQAVPGGKGYNAALGNGLDVLMGGGRRQFETPAKKGQRTDGRDLVEEMKAQGYSFAGTADELAAVKVKEDTRLLGLFNASHMSYDLDRSTTKEPSLADMTTKAMDVLEKKGHGYFLMVEGGRIDHALHETTARKALQDTVAFDQAIAAAIEQVKKVDPELKETLIVVTADHDHSIVLNGYAKRTGKTTDSNPGVLGLVHNYTDGKPTLDLDGAPYTIIGFGNGENRVQGTRASQVSLDDQTVFAKTYHQEAAIRTAVGGETHGGTDVFLGAMGRNADLFTGTMENTQVFGLVRKALEF